MSLTLREKEELIQKYDALIEKVMRDGHYCPEAGFLEQILMKAYGRTESMNRKVLFAPIFRLFTNLQNTKVKQTEPRVFKIVAPAPEPKTAKINYETQKGKENREKRIWSFIRGDDTSILNLH